MFKLRALHAKIERLRLRAQQLRFGLRNICTPNHADGVTVTRQLQRLRIGADGIVEQLLLRIVDAQLEIIDGEIRLCREASGTQIGDARLRSTVVGLVLAANAAP